MAPSADCAIRLKQRYGAALTVLVDACQFRLSTESLAGYLTRVNINGLVTTDLTDNSPKACKDGVIGLQMHGGFTMTIQFKDLKIKFLEKK